MGRSMVYGRTGMIMDRSKLKSLTRIWNLFLLNVGMKMEMNAPVTKKGLIGFVNRFQI
jgi:hypothetical protein